MSLPPDPRIFQAGRPPLAFSPFVRINCVAKTWSPILDDANGFAIILRVATMPASTGCGIKLCTNNRRFSCPWAMPAIERTIRLSRCELVPADLRIFCSPGFSVRRTTLLETPTRRRRIDFPSLRSNKRLISDADARETFAILMKSRGLRAIAGLRNALSASQLRRRAGITMPRAVAASPRKRWGKFWTGARPRAP